MAEKKKPFQTFEFNLDESVDQEVPAPPPALDKFFDENPAPTPRPVEPPPAPVKPARKGGRPKGPVKVKKSVYLEFDLSKLELLRFNAAVYGGVLTKDDGEVIDLALEVLDFISSSQSFSHMVKQAREYNRLK